MQLITNSKENIEIKAASLIKQKIEILLKSQKFVSFAVPGGRSVLGVFDKLKNEKIDWKKVHFFMIDERLVPLESEESNFKLANDSFFSYLVQKGKISKKNIHPFIYTGKLDLDLEKYRKEIDVFGEKFDITLLGAGEDGHIAALFPRHETIKSDKKYFVTTFNSPKPPKGRMSASRNIITRSNLVILLFLGQGKRNALENFRNDSLKAEECPAKIVSEIRDSYVFTDIR
jgi:6-phosphogluconolactonase